MKLSDVPKLAQDWWPVAAALGLTTYAALARDRILTCLTTQGECVAWTAVPALVLGAAAGFGGAALLERRRKASQIPTILQKPQSGRWSEGAVGQIQCLHLFSDWYMTGASAQAAGFGIIDAEVQTAWQFYPQVWRPRRGRLALMVPTPAVVNKNQMVEFNTVLSVSPRCRRPGEDLRATVTFTDHRGRKIRVDASFKAQPAPPPTAAPP